jgi:hypothetical protein
MGRVSALVFFTIGANYSSTLLGKPNIPLSLTRPALQPAGGLEVGSGSRFGGMVVK